MGDYSGGPTEEQQQLLELVGERVDAATVPGFGRTTPERPPPPTPEELQLKAEAKARGERQLMEAVRVFGDKMDADRFRTSLTLLEEAREAFRFAGSNIERERDGVMGNLYAVIIAEQERSLRVAKLVRMKKLLELTKLKRKGEAMGIDPDELEAVLEGEAEVKSASDGDGGGAGGDRAGDGSGDAALADDILAAWRKEGVDAGGAEIDELSDQIQKLEDSL